MACLYYPPVIMMFADFFLQVHDISCADWERWDQKKICQFHSTELFLWRFEVPYVWRCAETLKINLEDSKCSTKPFEKK